MLRFAAKKSLLSKDNDKGDGTMQKFKTWFSKENQVFRREFGVILIWAAILVGAVNFLIVVESSWDMLPNNWWWLVIAVATLSLPKTFKALKNNKDPVLVRFALAFRAGFFSISQLLPWLTEGKRRLITLWQRPNAHEERTNHHQPSGNRNSQGVTSHDYDTN